MTVRWMLGQRRNSTSREVGVVFRQMFDDGKSGAVIVAVWPEGADAVWIASELECAARELRRQA